MTTAPSLEVLRIAVRRAVEGKSLRSVAHRVGITPAELIIFLNGSPPPRENTRQLLGEWYMRDGSANQDAVAGRIGAALWVLLDGLPEDMQSEGAQELVEAVRGVYRGAGIAVPGWVEDLLR